MACRVATSARKVSSLGVARSRSSSACNVPTPRRKFSSVATSSLASTKPISRSISTAFSSSTSSVG